MSPRAMRNIVLRLPRNFSPQILQKSQRSYKVLKTGQSNKLRSTDQVIDILAALNKLGHTLEEFSFYSGCRPKDLEKILWNLPHLNTLEMVVSGCHFEKLNFPVLENLHTLQLENRVYNDLQIDVVQMAPNVRHLRVNPSKFKNQEYWLQTFNGYESHLKSLKITQSMDRNIPLHQLSMPQLEKLEVKGNKCSEYRIELTEALPASAPMLSTIRLNFIITPQILNTIGQRWPNLQELMFIVPNSDNNILRYLDKFKNLKVSKHVNLCELSFNKKTVFRQKLHIEDLLNASMLCGLEPLHSVREFVLSLHLHGDTTILAYRLSVLLPNIKSLEAHCFWLSSYDFLREICENLTALRHLEVDALICDNKRKNNAFVQLGNLVHLEELSLTVKQITLRTLLRNNVRRLKLKLVDRLDTNRLQHMADIFPRLQYLELANSKIPDNGFKLVRDTFPGCVIHFKE